MHFHNRNGFSIGSMARRGVFALAFAALPGLALAAPPVKTTGKAAAKAKPADNGAFAYGFKPGDTRHYKITAFFTGHFPPFSQPDSKPLNLRVILDYAAVVKKVDATGATMAFTVESDDLSLLAKLPGPDGKSNPDDELSLPLALEDVQKALDANATLRPDGSIASLPGGSAIPVKIDLGLDIRKLFLLTLPLTFPNKSVPAKGAWTFDDGILGRKQGKTTYTGRYNAGSDDKDPLHYAFRLDAAALVDGSMDKDNNLTDDPAKAAGTINGKVSLTGNLTYSSETSTPGSRVKGNKSLRLATGDYTFTALLNRKRDKSDPEHPEVPLQDTIDVTAHLLVQADNNPIRKAETAIVKPAAAQDKKSSRP